MADFLPASTVSHRQSACGFKIWVYEGSVQPHALSLSLRGAQATPQLRSGGLHAHTVPLRKVLCAGCNVHCTELRFLRAAGHTVSRITVTSLHIPSFILCSLKFKV